MTKRQGLMVSLKSARIIALIFFTVGTVLFGTHFLLPDRPVWIVLGLFYIFFAVLFNGIIALLLLIDLVRKDSLESFFGLCLILANVPVAVLYTYIMIETPL